MSNDPEQGFYLDDEQHLDDHSYLTGRRRKTSPTLPFHQAVIPLESPGPETGATHIDDYPGEGQPMSMPGAGAIRPTRRRVE